MVVGLALVLSLLVPAHAGSGEAPEVEVHKKGRKPRVALRLSPQGHQEAEVLTRASLETAAIIPVDIDMPASTYELSATPAGGEVGLEVTAVSVAELEDDPLDLRASMLESMEPWVGQRGAAPITEHGLGDWSLSAESEVTLIETLDILIPALPATPVGKGARWSTTTHSEMDGQPLTRTLTWTLREHLGSVVVLDVEGADALGEVAEGLEFSSTGTGRAEWDLSRPLPTASTWAQEMVMSGAVGDEGMEMPVDTTARVELALTSR